MGCPRLIPVDERHRPRTPTGLSHLRRLTLPAAAYRRHVNGQLHPENIGGNSRFHIVGVCVVAHHMLDVHIDRADCDPSILPRNGFLQRQGSQQCAPRRACEPSDDAWHRVSGVSGHRRQWPQLTRAHKYAYQQHVPSNGSTSGFSVQCARTQSTVR
eukprot:COSAG01_NODE_5664_length_4112_cov_8.551458_2_plen_157_part_00